MRMQCGFREELSCLVHPGWRQGRDVTLRQCPGFRHPCKPHWCWSLLCLSRELVMLQIHREVTEVPPGNMQGQIRGEEMHRTWRMPTEVKAEPQVCCKTPLTVLFPMQGWDLDLLGSVCVRGGSACPPGWQQLMWERSKVARVGLFGVPLLNFWVEGGPWESACPPLWYPPGSVNLLQMQVDPIAGPEDDLRYQCGRLGWVGAELKAEQGQGQSHLHLVHGKLLPNAVPEERMINSPTAAFIPDCPRAGLSPCMSFLKQHLWGAGGPPAAARMMPQLI